MKVIQNTIRGNARQFGLEGVYLMAVLFELDNGALAVSTGFVRLSPAPTTSEREAASLWVADNGMRVVKEETARRYFPMYDFAGFQFRKQG